MIAESDTLRSAAIKLNVTQPALTKMVQILEVAAGAKLLSRSRNGVKVTASGELLLRFASRTLRELEDLERKIANPDLELSGHIRIGAYASLAEYLWPHFISAVRGESPGLHFSIFTNESMSHIKALERGEIDLLVDAEPRLNGDFVSYKLYDDRFNFFSKEKVSKYVTPETCNTQPLIFSPAAFDENGQKILHHLESAGFQFRERMEMDSFNAVMAYAKAGLGLAVLPQRLAKSAVEEGSLNPVRVAGFTASGFGRHSFMATLHDSRKDDHRLIFLIRSLKQWCKSL